MPFKSLIRNITPLLLLIIFIAPASGQKQLETLSAKDVQKCLTTELMEAAIRQNPGIVQLWQKEGEKRYHEYLNRKNLFRGTLNDTIIIPVVFHLIDQADKQATIPDRTIYDQIEMMNVAFNGSKADLYKNVVPQEIYNRVGRIPVRFVLARRDPNGNLTSGIERRTGPTPDYIKIKSYADGGLDAWDTDKYLNIWTGTIPPVGGTSILGIATFPFTNDMGPQGVVIDIRSLPFTVNITRSYYPSYNEGVTLIHEVGHYFYLWHTFGDKTTCNNDDFRIQAGWPLPTGAGPEGDDTPAEKADGAGNAHFGNPSMDYSDGCTTEPFGEMWGSFMNYFDDRALFLFSEGYKKRVLGTIEYYRPDLANSDGAVAPGTVNDAYVVTALPYGSTERRAYIKNNVPLSVLVRNYGNTTLTSLKLEVKIDNAVAFSQTFSLSLAPGAEIVLPAGNINTTAGTHMVEIISSNPNGTTDAFTTNDTLQSFVTVAGTAQTAPFREEFSGGTFPPAGWNIWNPNNDATWIFDATSGYNGAGSASMKYFTSNKPGSLDELILPPIKTGSADSSVLSFKVAYGAYDERDVSVWDGLEIYLSNDDGRTYKTIYRKSGTHLASVSGNTRTAFNATTNSSWKHEEINLTPYLVSGKDFLIKFRAVNGYGNNLYIDDVNVSAVVSLARDLEVTGLTNLPLYNCDAAPAPVLSIRSNGKDVLTSLKINYRINGGPVNTIDKSLNLAQGAGTTINLPALSSLSPGGYDLTVYTSQPNGLADEAPINDTIRTRFYILGNTTLPVSESFESSTFPPSEWVVQHNGNGQTWERSTQAASAGTASAVMKNFIYNSGGREDNLISPKIVIDAEYDSLFFSFDYAYAPGSNYPGAPGNPEDTLEVKISLDCGQSFITVWKKFGNEMVTVGNPEAYKNISFIAQNGDWTSVKIYLTPIVGNNDFRVFFSSKGNNRNNLYLDNIKAYGITVPPLLKEKGYLFYPSPFKDQFIIRNYQQPTSLKSIRIYNMTGQLVWQKEYNGDAYTQMYVNTASWPAGIYTVKMNFANKTVIDRVVKQ